MAASKSFFHAQNLPEVFYQIKNTNDLNILAGCSCYALHDIPFPEKNLSVRNIQELRHLEKRERYFEMGSAVTLNEIAELEAKNLPATIYEAVKSIANPTIRNLATIGGNICSKEFYHTLYAPLLALDARLEFIDETETTNINIMKFENVPERSLLSKIKIPFEEWEVAVFKRLGPSHTINDLSASFVFLANSQKKQISNLRIAFAGKFKFRDTELENKLIGAHLPLSSNTISEFVIEAEAVFNQQADEAGAPPILKKQFWNLVNYSLEQLT